MSAVRVPLRGTTTMGVFGPPPVIWTTCTPSTSMVYRPFSIEAAPMMSPVTTLVARTKSPLSFARPVTVAPSTLPLQVGQTGTLTATAIVAKLKDLPAMGGKPTDKTE